MPCRIPCARDDGSVELAAFEASCPSPYCAQTRGLICARLTPFCCVISRFSVSPVNGSRAEANSEKIVLQVPQPYPNHKGGQIAFGRDGYLYIGLGDGGGEGDPLGNGQNLSTLLGKILRIDVNSGSPGLNYSIPRDNPFVGNTKGYRAEIYAYGLRNRGGSVLTPQLVACGLEM